MDKLNIALIGCGSFAREVHIPNMMADGRFRVYAAVDTDPDAARTVGEAVGATYWTNNVERALADPNVDAVLIVTPHHTHADLAVRAARAGKHIFCEKPMGLNEKECMAVADAVSDAKVKYTAGYNRSQAPFTLKARAILAELQMPILVSHRMADWNPYSRGWLADEKLSGGRLIGEAGHALDMICQLVGQNPCRVYAEGGYLVQLIPNGAPDSAIVSLGFPDGSAGVSLLSSVANSGFPKEEVHVSCANHTIMIYGFQRMDVFSPSGQETFTLEQIDKGQAALLSAFAQAILTDGPSPGGLDVALRASRCTFAALLAVQTHEVQNFG